jgi:hypothetical protein
MTAALEGGEGSASCPGRSLTSGKTQYPLYRRLGEFQGRSGQVRKILPSPGFDPRTVQPVASRYTMWAASGHWGWWLFCANLISNITHVFMNKQFKSFQNFFWCCIFALLGKGRHFVLSDVSTGSLTLCQGQHVASDVQVECACCRVLLMCTANVYLCKKATYCM